MMSSGLEGFNYPSNEESLVNASRISLCEEGEPMDVQERHNFVPGDGVEVIKGNFWGLTGKITKIVGSIIWMLPYHEDMKDELGFQPNELKKFFEIGDHVSVISGQYEGDTGIIVRVMESQIVLISDSIENELQVLAKDLRQLAKVNITVDQPVVQFQPGNLIQLDCKTVGVIISLETMENTKEPFQILTMYDKLVNVPHRMIIEKLDPKNPIGIDSDSNRIEVENIMHVIKGPYKGKKGEIRHLYDGFAFLFSDIFLHNGGLFVCETRNLLLQKSWEAKQAEIINSDSELMGKTIKIIQGYYENYVGIVKHIMGSKVRVGSHETQKMVTVDRNIIRIVEADGRDLTEDTPQIELNPCVSMPSSDGQEIDLQQDGRIYSDDELVGKTIKVTQGYYKNYVGIVRDVMDSIVRVGSNKNPMTITVDKNIITFVESNKKRTTKKTSQAALNPCVSIDFGSSSHK